MEIQAAAAPKTHFPLPRWLPWSHGLILALTVTFWGMFLFKAEPLGYVYKRDFLSVYIGARTVANGMASRLYDTQLQWELTNSAIFPYHRSTLLPFIYPAYVAVLLAPLGRLSLVRAFFIWTGINFLVTCWLIRRLTQVPRLFPAQRTAFFIAFLAWVPLQLTLSHGQMGLICTLAVSETMIALEIRKEWRAGCWLALGLIKPQLIALPLLALLLFRCWRAIATFTTALIVLLAATFGKAGFWIPEYLRFLVRFNRSGKDWSLYPIAMQNWRGLVHAMLGTSTSIAAYSLIGALSLASMLTVVFVCWEPHVRRASLSELPYSSTDRKARFSIAILIGLLVSPYLYFHDWVVAFPALAVLFLAATEWSRLRDRYHWLGTAILWLIALSPFVCFAAQFGIWPANTHIQLVPWYMAFLTVLAVVRLRTADKKIRGASA
jgi:glycosyl transferase family 87